jgi:hypothetical protein
LTPIGIIRGVGSEGADGLTRQPVEKRGDKREKEGSIERRERERNGDGVEALLEKRTGIRGSNHDHVAQAEARPWPSNKKLQIHLFLFHHRYPFLT